MPSEELHFSLSFLGSSWPLILQDPFVLGAEITQLLKSPVACISHPVLPFLIYKILQPNFSACSGWIPYEVLPKTKPLSSLYASLSSQKSICHSPVQGSLEGSITLIGRALYLSFPSGRWVSDMSLCSCDRPLTCICVVTGRLCMLWINMLVYACVLSQQWVASNKYRVQSMPTSSQQLAQLKTRLPY